MQYYVFSFSLNNFLKKVKKNCIRRLCSFRNKMFVHTSNVCSQQFQSDWEKMILGGSALCQLSYLLLYDKIFSISPTGSLAPNQKRSCHIVDETQIGLGLFNDESIIFFLSEYNYSFYSIQFHKLGLFISVRSIFLDKEGHDIKQRQNPRTHNQSMVFQKIILGDIQYIGILYLIFSTIASTIQGQVICRFTRFQKYIDQNSNITLFL